MMSTISVIIPCYKYGRYLRDCIGSVLGQGGVDIRALVIDDASPDDSADVAAELASQDSRLEFRRHAANHGHIATYNEGIDWASGDYLLLLSADDLLIPGALQRAVRLLDTQPRVGFTYGRQIVFRGEHAPASVPLANNDVWRVVEGPDFIADCCAQGHNPVATPTVVVRTALQKKLGGYRKELPHTADMELWLRFASCAGVGVIEADQALKRAHECNMQIGYTATLLPDLRQRQAAFAAFFNDRGARLANAAVLHRKAEQTLAESAFWTASRAFDEGSTEVCQELLDFAVHLDPALASQQHWARLRWKRRIGPKLWTLLRPLVRRPPESPATVADSRNGHT